jgi:hypothetical protein
MNDLSAVLTPGPSEGLGIDRSGTEGVTFGPDANVGVQR